MCGIIGVAAQKGNVVPLIIGGLKRLEYRGYDSAGIAVVSGSTVSVRKGAGKIEHVVVAKGFEELNGSTGIGHTRWATHGAPNDINAHPHTDCTGSIAVVHNGIIKNYAELKEELVARGHRFSSETDTEVIAHLIEEELRRQGSFHHAFQEAVKRLEGSFAIAVLYSGEPDRIYFAKKDSPLVVGLGRGANFLASDIPAFLEHTRRVIVLRDGEAGWITSQEVHIENVYTGESVDVPGRVRTISWSPSMAAKGGYPHFMLKEIHEQPRALRDTFYGLSSDESLAKAAELLAGAERIYVTAAGTSFHAGLLFDYYMLRLAGRTVRAFIASEYEWFKGVPGRGDVLLAISQSGETMDTLKAVRLFKEHGARVIALSNVYESAIPRESGIAIYTRAGPEIGVAASKTFLTQALALLLLAGHAARISGRITRDEMAEIMSAASKASRLAQRAISVSEGVVRTVAKWFSKKGNAYILSRGIGVPIAMEGALKVKEISYIHAEAYPAGESKHGPIALIEPGFPVFFLLVDQHLKELKGNVMEMKARGATVVAVGPPRSEILSESDIHIPAPEAPPLLEPFTLTPPLQLLAYYTAVSLGYNPDKPRNLAKTVTVE